jgi:NADPH:quinone reductase-like Zn-dependent oxidoreductase
MKAIIRTRYGSPDVLQLADVEKPTPKDNEVLIKIHAATVTPSDCAFRKGEPFIVKLIYGLGKPRLAAQGVELAGEIEAMGQAVRLFKPGDQVFGMSPKFGAHAEYVCLPESGVLAIKPVNVTYAEAAGICDGATTALTFLRDKAHVRPGQKVLVNGASGSVGAYAVQLAKCFGAEVTGVCSSANVQMVKSLGADQLIDYTRADFTRSGQLYDVIFDAVGKSSFPKCKDALTPKGIYLSTVPTLGIVWHMLWTSVLGGKKAVFATAGLEQSKDNLDYLRQLVESGAIKPVIDRRYPLEQAPEAHRYVDTGRKKGSVIITVAHGAHA